MEVTFDGGKVITAHLNPLYSYLSAVKGMKVLWDVGCKAGTERQRAHVSKPRFRTAQIWEVLTHPNL